MRKAVLLLGPGRNGKSVLLSIIKALLGPANVSAVTLQAFGENRFAGAELFGRLANIAGDLDARAIRNTDLFKMITGGTDAIQAERKFRDSFNFVPFALPIFSANEAPQSADQSDAWFDRWLIVPMERRIADEVADPHLGERLTTEPELRGLLVHAVAGLRRLMARGRFELSEAVQRAQVSYRERLDTIESFLTDATVRVASAWTPRPQLYRGYRAWCEAEGRIAVSPGMLCEQLRRRGVRESKRRGVWGWDGLGLAA
jgi:P4 family phage/plasmid primase-like protien